ncbi:MAG: hypothetical protein K9J82_08395 [Methylotenera sp.]|nr:hypothetical protein [Methylotenera sp.]
MHLILSSLLRRARAGILVMLVLVLPLHSVAQLAAGLKAQRHVHTGAARTAAVGAGVAVALPARLAGPLRGLLDQLHAAQDVRLAGHGGWPGQGRHAHGGVFHTHDADTRDVLDLADPGDEGRQVGATLFLAWLPQRWTLAEGQALPPLMGAARTWRDRIVPPPLAPPRA